MNKGIEVEVQAEQVGKQRINFSDGNRSLHLKIFLEWLPSDLYNAPLIDWALFPTRVIAHLTSLDQNNIFAKPLALIAGIISGISGSQNESTLYHNINRIKLLLDKVQIACGIQSINELTEEAWETFINSSQYSTADYKALQMYRTCTEYHLSAYLTQLEPQQRAGIAAYILPSMPYRFLERKIDGRAIEEETKVRRKAQTEVIAPLHSILVALVQFRKQNAQRLLNAYWEARQRVGAEHLSLPLTFSYEDELVTVNQDASTVSEIRLEKRKATLHFRLWDRNSWQIDHPHLYKHTTWKRAQNISRQFEEPQYFLEFLDKTEDFFWFGELIKYRLLQRETVNRISPENEQRRNEILEKMDLKVGVDCSRGGLLAPRIDFAHFLNKAAIRSRAIIFDIESLYRGILFGAALATLALTNGSRMCELLQVSADRFNTRTYKVKQDGQATEEERVLHLQLLLPKFRRTEEERKLFLISDQSYALLCEIAQELRNAHGGHIPVVHPSYDNSKKSDLKPERYLFQWNASDDGVLGAVRPIDVSHLIRVILYGLEFRTKEGEIFNVTVHLLRHVMATVAVHDHEVPIEAVAHALHHESEWRGSAFTSVPKSTLYYSQEPEERSIITFAAFQMEVEEWVARLEVGFPSDEELAGMDDDLRESFERWHTLLETTFGYCGNSNLCPRGYNRTLCIGCPHLIPDPRKLQQVFNWRNVYEKHAEELEIAGNTVDARQFRLLVKDLDNLIAEMKILQASIEDGRRKPLFLLLPSPSHDEVVIDAEAFPQT